MRSKAEGVPPLCTWPRIVTRVSKPRHLTTSWEEIIHSSEQKYCGITCFAIPLMGNNSINWTDESLMGLMHVSDTALCIYVKKCIHTWTDTSHTET